MSDTTDVVAADPATVAEQERRRHELAEHPEQLPMLPGEVHPHPTPRQYVLIGLVLVVITAAEVAVSYLEGDVSDGVIIAVLLIMAAVKFFLVAAWYMHLRTDLKIFRRMFVVGLVGASIVYAIALATFRVYDKW
ncbi:MAG TPA: cytochrome C oxidase subunit IV family protein [Acidimicrobiia bacterium]|nr:cytochrome C oxidase subunit IV family protein [Acidimicrobiia bacterium]